MNEDSPTRLPSTDIPSDVPFPHSNQLSLVLSLSLIIRSRFVAGARGGERKMSNAGSIGEQESYLTPLFEFIPFLTGV
jgi:hypothetical protein